MDNSSVYNEIKNIIELWNYFYDLEAYARLPGELDKDRDMVKSTVIRLSEQAPAGEMFKINKLIDKISGY